MPRHILLVWNSAKPAAVNEDCITHVPLYINKMASLTWIPIFARFMGECALDDTF